MADEDWNFRTFLGAIPFLLLWMAWAALAAIALEGILKPLKPGDSPCRCMPLDIAETRKHTGLAEPRGMAQWHGESAAY